MDEISSAIRERRSIRRYLPRPVPQATLREILDDARWSPSWGNTQSWFVYVLSGHALDRFKAGLLERATTEAPSNPDIDMPASWPEPFQGRMKSLMQARMAFVAEEERKRGIVPVDPPVPPPVAGAALFGAPHLLVVATDKEASRPYACYNAGLLSQTIALAAHARGLGTCIVAGAMRSPDLLREIVPGSEDKVFIAGMAIGFPDTDAIVNQFPRQRASLEDYVRFIDE